MKHSGHISGWSWLCACGWSTERRALIEQVEHQRSGHLAFHRAQHHEIAQKARQA